jgi:cytochrome c553
MTTTLRTLAMMALVAVAVPAVAQNKPSQVAWDLKTVEAVRAGNAERGKALHANCVACHGATGVSESPEFPDLAGQDALYLYKQLHDYRSGARVNALMQGYVAGLSERDMADLAQFYARQKRGGSATPGAVPPAVLELIERGDGSRMLVGCAYCHGPAGGGNPGMYGMPMLLGQKGVYLQQTLIAFARGERHNDIYRAMRDVARKLDASEVAALASYYSGGRVAVLPITPPASVVAAPPAPAVTDATSKVAAGTGWYTTAQAQRGAPLYAAQCASCHGASLEGGMGPALSGRAFWTRWGGQSFDALWKTVHKQMPLQSPGSDKAPVSIDILAYLLSRNGVAAGATPLDDTTDLRRALPAR